MRISRKAKRELRFILLFVGSLSLMYALIFGEGGYLELRKSQLELRKVQLENLRLREKHHLYLQRINELRNDPIEIERIARGHFNLARPGDIIVNLPDE